MRQQEGKLSCRDLLFFMTYKFMYMFNRMPSNEELQNIWHIEENEKKAMETKKKGEQKYMLRTSHIICPERRHVDSGHSNGNS